MSRARFIIGFLVVLIPVSVLGSLAWAGNADLGKLPTGARIGEVDVGGLSRADALVKLKRVIARPASRDVVVTVGEREFRLTADKAGVTLDIPAAVQRAYDAAHHGNFIQRGFRRLTGQKATVDEGVTIGVDRAAVRSFVGSIHSAVARKPKDATIAMTLTSVTTSPAQDGRRLAGRDALVARIADALRKPGGERAFSARTATVPANVSDHDVWGANPIAVTVSKQDRRVRVFDRGDLVTSYRVAVGMAEYPTPNGRFAIQSVEKNPTWTVPDSDWAGELRGKVIPGGDPQNPLKAYFVRFDGAVGFHGTASINSLGTAASHGCIRMRVRDVKDLAKRVSVGTPVLVG
ncbi:MAG TPA: L,D-transpeptidase/peptidoglycan binding protein [Solirubrobacteraceae bacterium]